MVSMVLYNMIVCYFFKINDYANHTFNEKVKFLILEIITRLQNKNINLVDSSCLRDNNVIMIFF